LVSGADGNNEFREIKERCEPKEIRKLTEVRELSE
jgi:hypothetical protein